MWFPLRRLLPTADWTRALIAPVLVFVATAIDRNYQTDFWHHLARGQAMSERGEFVDQDLFSFTVHGQPLQDVNWLPQLLYARLFALGGLELVQTVNSLTLAAVMGVLVALCRRSSGSLLVAAAVGVFSFFGLWQLLIIRPQTFSLLLFVMLYAVLELSEKRPWLLLVPPAFVGLWANVHGAFLIGPFLIGCYLLAAVVERAWSGCWAVLRDRRVWALGACLAAAVLATGINPYGYSIYRFVAATTGSSAGRRIDEWVPPGLGPLAGKVFILSVLLVLVLFALPGRRPRVREVVLVLAFLPLAAGSVRMVVWWFLVTAPVVAALAAANLPRRLTAEGAVEGPSFATGATVAGLLLAAMICLPWLDDVNPVFRGPRSTHRPESDLEAVLRPLQGQHAGGRIFTRFEWAEYVGWRLAPDHTIFMDARMDVFPDRIWAEYEAVTRGRADWERILDAYQVDWMLLDRAGYHSGLLPQVEQSAAWERVAHVGDAVLFARRPATHTSVARAR